jgi:hypothetical protein
MKKYIAVFLVGIILGGVVHSKKHYFIRIFKKKIAKEELAKRQNILTSYNKSIIVSKYTTGSPLFIDRSYFDQNGDKRLEGLFLILTTRHRQGLIEINSKYPITVYRLVSEANDNSIFDDYEVTDIKVKVVGGGSVHTKVLKKNFPKGIISLAAGGPTSASPILISVAEKALNDFGFELISN